MLHLSEQQIAQYGQKKLSVAELLSVDDHLSDCAECRNQIVVFFEADQRSSENEIVSYEVNPHLVYEDQGKYFSGQLTEERLEYCLNHILWCDLCRMDLVDFSIFHSHLKTVSDELVGRNKRLREGSTQVSGSTPDFSSQLFFKSLDD